jgi:hypothetical protein
MRVLEPNLRKKQRKSGPLSRFGYFASNATLEYGDFIHHNLRMQGFSETAERVISAPDMDITYSSPKMLPDMG